MLRNRRVGKGGTGGNRRKEDRMRKRKNDGQEEEDGERRGCTAYRQGRIKGMKNVEGVGRKGEQYEQETE